MLNLTHTKIIETEKDGNKDREALHKLMKCSTYEVKQGKTQEWELKRLVEMYIKIRLHVT